MSVFHVFEIVQMLPTHHTCVLSTARGSNFITGPQAMAGRVLEFAFVRVRAFAQNFSWTWPIILFWNSARQSQKFCEKTSLG